MATNDFQYGGWNSYTLQCGTIMTLACGSGIMRVNLLGGSIGPPCNVTRGSGMTCHWIRPNVLHVNVNVNSRFIQRRVMMHLYYAVCAGSDEIGSFSAIEIPLLVSISAISPQSTCRSAPVCEILSKSDHSRQKKWCHVDFQYGRAPPYWILGVQ